MRRIAICLLLTSLGSATVFGQGGSENLGSKHGTSRADLANLHRVAERARTASQIDPSRLGTRSDAQQTRGNTAQRLTKKTRLTNKTRLTKKTQSGNSAVSERLRQRENDGVERHEPSRVENRERLTNRAALNDPQHLALRQRLALIDRMRDDALAREDVRALDQADQMERRIRERFEHARRNGVPFQPLPEMNTADNSNFVGPGYGPLTAGNAREPGNQFGEKTAAAAQYRHENREVRIPFRPGAQSDGSPAAK